MFFPAAEIGHFIKLKGKKALQYSMLKKRTPFLKLVEEWHTLQGDCYVYVYAKNFMFAEPA